MRSSPGRSRWPRSARTRAASASCTPCRAGTSRPPTRTSCTTRWTGWRPLRPGCRDMTGQLIGRFCDAAQAATRERYGDGPLVRYAARLVVPRATTAEILALKGLAVTYAGSYTHLRAHETVLDLVCRLL